MPIRKRHLYGRVISTNRSRFICESVLYDDHRREITRARGIFVRGKLPLSEVRQKRIG
jgi:hypothetical protein